MARRNYNIPRWSLQDRRLASGCVELLQRHEEEPLTGLEACSLPASSSTGD